MATCSAPSSSADHHARSPTNATCVGCSSAHEATSSGGAGGAVELDGAPVDTAAQLREERGDTSSSEAVSCAPRGDRSRREGGGRDGISDGGNSREGRARGDAGTSMLARRRSASGLPSPGTRGGCRDTLSLGEGDGWRVEAALEDAEEAASEGGCGALRPRPLLLPLRGAASIPYWLPR